MICRTSSSGAVSMCLDRGLRFSVVRVLSCSKRAGSDMGQGRRGRPLRPNARRGSASTTEDVAGQRGAGGDEGEPEEEPGERGKSRAAERNGGGVAVEDGRAPEERAGLPGPMMIEEVELRFLEGAVLRQPPAEVAVKAVHEGHGRLVVHLPERGERRLRAGGPEGVLQPDHAFAAAPRAPGRAASAERDE